MVLDSGLPNSPSILVYLGASSQVAQVNMGVESPVPTASEGSRRMALFSRPTPFRVIAGGGKFVGRGSAKNQSVFPLSGSD